MTIMANSMLLVELIKISECFYLSL